MNAPRFAGYCLACTLALAPASALEVGDAVFADQVEIGEHRLSIRGGGTLRWKRLIAIYDAALWTAPADADPLGEAPRRIAFRYRRAFTAAELAEATTATLGRSLPQAERDALAADLARLNALYQDVVAGDLLQLTYLPGVGTEVALAGTVRGVVGDAGFARALFAIWLGDDPVDARFRAALLGG
jgi:hypothetical protein